jgi:hypothetical protein
VCGGWEGEPGGGREWAARTAQGGAPEQRRARLFHLCRRSPPSRMKYAAILLCTGAVELSVQFFSFYFNNMKCIFNEYDLYGTICYGPAENLPELIRNYQNCKMNSHENPMRVKDQ